MQYSTPLAVCSLDRNFDFVTHGKHKWTQYIHVASGRVSRKSHTDCTLIRFVLASCSTICYCLKIRYNLYRLKSKRDGLYVFPPFGPIQTYLEHDHRYFHLLKRTEKGWLLKIILYSNQINARALISQLCR